MSDFSPYLQHNALHPEMSRDPEDDRISAMCLQALVHMHTGSDQVLAARMPLRMFRE